MGVFRVTKCMKKYEELPFFLVMLRHKLSHGEVIELLDDKVRSLEDVLLASQERMT